MNGTPHFSPSVYIDDYNSCIRCYATLALYNSNALPKEVTDCLNLQPSRLVHKYSSPKTNYNAWFLSTRDLINSKDLRRHLNFLTQQLKDKEILLRNLVNNGWDTRIYCFWESKNGNGGPILDSYTMHRISQLQLEIHFDIWFE